MIEHFFRSRAVIPHREGGARSYPREVTTTVPHNPPVSTGPIEFPQPFTTTVPSGLQPLLPLNGSKLATGFVPSGRSVPVEHSE